MEKLLYEKGTNLHLFLSILLEHNNVLLAIFWSKSHNQV